MSESEETPKQEVQEQGEDKPAEQQQAAEDQPAEQQQAAEDKSAEATEDKPAEQQQATEDKPAEQQATEDKPAEQQQATEDKPAEAIATEDKLADQQQATEDKPAEQQATEDKPAEQQATEDKPAEQQQATEDKPAEQQQAPEDKPAEQQQATEDKPAEQQQGSEDKPEAKPAADQQDKPAEPEATAAAEQPQEAEKQDEQHAEAEPEQLADPEEPDDGVPRVLVTGASGYIATHLIKQLLEQGRFHVRGSVRSLKRDDKVKPLRELVSDATYPLRLIEADLQKPKTWTKAVEGCTYVFHVASPFPFKPPKNENELIQPAVDGTKNVLQACAEAGTVKRVVVTSSVAAVSSGMWGNPGQPADYVYTEKDWSVEAACAPYEKSKLKAEQAAWEFVKGLEEGKQFELVVVNPGYVQGPLLSRASGASSAQFCDQILGNKLPGLVNASFGLVDVRDVAAAHIAAIEKPEAAGNRYLLVAETLHFKAIAQIISQEFKPQGYKIPTKQLPKIGLWVAKLFNSSAKAVYPHLGKVVRWSNERMKGELGIHPRPAQETMVDMCYSLVELGITKRTPGYLGHPSTRPKPKEEKPEEGEQTAEATEPPKEQPTEENKPQDEAKDEPSTKKKEAEVQPEKEEPSQEPTTQETPAETTEPPKEEETKALETQPEPTEGQ